MKRTPRPPEFNWTRILARRLHVLGPWPRRGRKIKPVGGFARPGRTLKVAGGMRHYWRARQLNKWALAKLPRSKHRMGHGRPINRPVK